MYLKFRMGTKIHKDRVDILGKKKNKKAYVTDHKTFGFWVDLKNGPKDPLWIRRK